MKKLSNKVTEIDLKYLTKHKEDLIYFIKQKSGLPYFVDNFDMFKKLIDPVCGSKDLYEQNSTDGIDNNSPLSNKDFIKYLTHHKEDLMYFIKHKNDIAFFIDNVDKFKKLIDQDCGSLKDSHDESGTNRMSIDSCDITNLHESSEGWLDETVKLHDYWKQKYGHLPNFSARIRNLNNVLSKIERGYNMEMNNGIPAPSVLSAITVKSVKNIVTNTKWSPSTKSYWLGLIENIIAYLTDDETSDKSTLLLQIKSWKSALNLRRNRMDIKNIPERPETLVSLSRIFSNKVLEFWFEKFESGNIIDAERILGLLFYIFFRNTLNSMLDIKWKDFGKGSWNENQEIYRFMLDSSQSDSRTTGSISYVLIPSNLYTLFVTFKRKSNSEYIFSTRSSLMMNVHMRKWLKEFTGYTVMDIDKLRIISMTYLHKKEDCISHFENFTFAESDDEDKFEVLPNEERDKQDNEMVAEKKACVNSQKKTPRSDLMSETQETLISLSRIFDSKVIDHCLEKINSNSIKDAETILGLLFYIFFRNNVESMLEVKWNDFDNGCWDENRASYRFTPKFSTNSFSNKATCNVTVIPSSLYNLFLKLKKISKSECIFPIRSSLSMRVKMRTWLHDFTGYTLMDMEKLGEISMAYLRKKDKSGSFESFTFVESDDESEGESDNCQDIDEGNCESDVREVTVIINTDKKYDIKSKSKFKPIKYS